MATEKIAAYQLRIPEKLKKAAEKAAKIERRSLNQYILHALESAVARPKDISPVAMSNTNLVSN